MIEAKFVDCGWHRTPKGAIRGVPFSGMRALAPEVAIQEASDALAQGRFSTCVREWNGFFAVVALHEHGVGLGVDRSRSIPLFYSSASQSFLISDDANWIREKLGNPPLDEVRKAEMCLAGFVLGAGTLCADIQQVQSGETVCAAQVLGHPRWNVERSRYRVFHPNGLRGATYEECLTRYDHVLTRCFERLIRVTRGRRILVPLSGGYDSRLVLLMLLRHGVKSVCTYTYGRNSQETRRSQEVASSLGVPWRICDYSAEAWRRAAAENSLWAYVRRASNLSSIACVREWLAIKEHIDNGLASSETLVVPGYAADLPAGSFLSHFHTTKIASRREFETLVWRNRLSEWDARTFSESVRAKIVEHLGLTIDCLGHVRDWHSAQDAWMFTEKVPKFTVNAIRAAEWHGCDWWLPFFDEDFLAFWEELPFEFRLGERLHFEFTDRLYSVLTGAEAPSRQCNAKLNVATADNRWSRFRERGWSCLRNVYYGRVISAFRVQRQLTRALAGYRDHDVGWAAILREQEYLDSVRRGARSHGAALTAKYLDLVK